MSKKLRLTEVKIIAMANYDHGGDYLIEMFNDNDLYNMFCVEGGKRKLYGFMKNVKDLRKNICKYCVG